MQNTFTIGILDWIINTHLTPLSVTCRRYSQETNCDISFLPQERYDCTSFCILSTGNSSETAKQVNVLGYSQLSKTIVSFGKYNQRENWQDLHESVSVSLSISLHKRSVSSILLTGPLSLIPLYPALNYRRSSIFYSLRDKRRAPYARQY